MSETLVLIPAFNEETSIEQVVLQSLQFSDVCVVNDASSDGTAKILQQLLERPFDEGQKKLHVISHEFNTHIPRSVQDGMAWALQKDYRYVIGMDAGFSHNPLDLVSFIHCVDCDLVIGHRTKKIGVPIFRRLLSASGNFIINFMLGRFFSERLHDATSGFRRYSRRTCEAIVEKKLKSKAFDFHLETLFIVKNFGGNVQEVEISYRQTNSSLNGRVILQALKFLFKNKS